MFDKSELRGDMADNVDASERAKFERLAQEWWNPDGQFKTVLAFNRVRSDYIQRQIAEHFNRANNFNGLQVLDIGCGAGLLCEPLAKRGGQVLGVDASANNIQVAQTHAKQQGLLIDYRHQLSHQLPQDHAFDVVMNTEVIEHVPDQQALLDDCARLLKPGGLLVLATLNRTWRSWLFGIVGAEYVLGLLPKGTHSWRKFVQPKEMAQMLTRHQLYAQDSTGLAFNPLTKNWKLSRNQGINYIMVFSANS